VGGNPARPVLVLLHGFPQTHVMWHRVAQALADRFFIVMPDLRGYGDSALKPGVAELPDHSQHSKRAMAADVVAVLADEAAAKGVALPEPNFLNRVALDFGVAHTDQHYHVPLLVSPWSYSTYRGS